MFLTHLLTNSRPQFCIIGRLRGVTNFMCMGLHYPNFLEAIHPRVHFQWPTTSGELSFFNLVFVDVSKKLDHPAQGWLDSQIDGTILRLPCQWDLEDNNNSAIWPKSDSQLPPMGNITAMERLHGNIKKHSIMKQCTLFFAGETCAAMWISMPKSKWSLSRLAEALNPSCELKMLPM